MSNLRKLYDNYYFRGYRKDLIAYEIARFKALEHFISKILKLSNVSKLLDYGSGSGLHVGLWKKLFPNTSLYFCDISQVALDNLIKKYPVFKDTCKLIKNGRAAFEDNFADIIVSIEVMEHVADLNEYLNDIHRLLKPGGIFIWTTPCANYFSIEQLYGFFTHQIIKTDEGYRRWRWEDPTHIRRLKSDEIKKLLMNMGFDGIRLMFRAHFFSFICVNFFQSFLRKIGERIMLLDYILFRYFPNGASMIG
ncbi:MAG: class I SAM-dependent methyltransferase, partial [Candidatus Hodarchaeota archaeon]